MSKIKSLISVLLVAGISVFPSVSFAKPNCYSAKNCTGKILNNKDQHNCKLSGGKSWEDGRGGKCVSPL